MISGFSFITYLITRETIEWNNGWIDRPVDRQMNGQTDRGIDG